MVLERNVYIYHEWCKDKYEDNTVSFWNVGVYERFYKAENDLPFFELVSLRKGYGEVWNCCTSWHDAFDEHWSFWA